MKLEEKRLSWHGLTDVPEQTTIEDIEMNGAAKGRRGKGRPRDCWMDGVGLTQEHEEKVTTWRRFYG